MGELDTYKDRVIAFEAVKKSKIPSRMTVERQPLQPSNYQALKKDLTPMKDPPALFVPGSENSVAKRELRDENAGLVPQANPRSSARGQDHKSNAMNRFAQDSVQSCGPSIYSSPNLAPGSMANVQAQGMIPGTQGMIPGTSNIMPASTDEEPRLQPIISPIIASNAFEFYCETHIAENRVALHRLPDRKSSDDLTLWFPLNFAETLQDWLNYSWACMVPSQRAAWEAGARATGDTQIVPPAPKAEPNIKKNPRLEEIAIYSAETELPKQQFFQLQNLLKDASPEVLERGVEQGVKLLGDLRAPMLEKAEGSSDAGQWIQQIGEMHFCLEARRVLLILRHPAKASKENQNHNRSGW